MTLEIIEINKRGAVMRLCERGGRLLLLAGTLLVGPACGNVAAPVADPETAAATRTPSGAASPTQGAPTVVAGPLAVDYARIPQSKTPEGYFVLGRPDAPLVMQHYSDFL